MLCGVPFSEPQGTMTGHLISMLETPSYLLFRSSAHAMETNHGNGTFDLQDIFNFWDSQRSSQLAETPSSTGVVATPLRHSAAASTSSTTTPRASSLQPSNLRERTFVEEADWKPERIYDLTSSLYICYTIEWKVTKRETLNRRKVSSDTELNVVLAPGPYWERCLKARLMDLVEHKFAGNADIRPDDTDVVLSVTERSEPDVKKRFNGLDIDWTVIQTQLETWSQYLPKGKKLRLNLSFNYLQVGPRITNPDGKRGDKRGPVSTTQRMLAERSLRLDAEHAASGQPSIWVRVYGLFRCPGSPCALGPHCWVDPVGKKHYRLLTHHLKELVRLVEQGGKLESHDDLPFSLRQQLCAEEQQRRDRKSGKVTESPGGHSPVTINILPSHPQQAMSLNGRPPRAGSLQILDLSLVDDLEIEGPRDVAVRKFSTWLQGQYQDPLYQEEVRKAEQVVLEEGFSLGQIYQGRASDLFAGKKLKRGVADAFTNDIPVWNKRQKEHHLQAGDDVAVGQFKDVGSSCII